MRKGGPVVHERRVPAKKTLITGGNLPPTRAPSKVLRTGGPGQKIAKPGTLGGRRLPPVSTPLPPTRKAPKKRRTY